MCVCSVVVRDLNVCVQCSGWVWLRDLNVCVQCSVGYG